MKKIMAYLCLPFLGLLLSGCFNILEEVHLNKNGSGKYSVTYDLGGLFNDPMMKGLMMESLKESGEIDLGSDGALEMDSLIYLRDHPEFQSLAGSKKLKETAKMHMVMSEDKGEYFAKFEFEFEKVAEIGTFMKSIGESSNQNAMGGLESFISGTSFTSKKKCLTRNSVKSEAKPLAGEDEMAMVKMFMGDAKYTTTYYLPGKVKKSSMSNSSIDGKTVTVTTPVLDVMDDAAAMNGEIKFKN